MNWTARTVFLSWASLMRNRGVGILESPHSTGLPSSSISVVAVTSMSGIPVTVSRPMTSTGPTEAPTGSVGGKEGATANGAKMHRSRTT